MLRIALTLSALLPLCAASCTPAHAQPNGVGGGPPSSSCEDGVLWNRSADITFCAATCRADSDCAGDERCRVLNTGERPGNRPVFVDDMLEELAAARAAAHAANVHPKLDAPPVCEGDCAPYTGDLRVRPSVPLSVCDPFHDIQGAMLSEADEADIAASDGDD